MNEFSLRELECFLAVAEELSFTRAAERLHLAQPPLSRHIKNLEEKLGVLLFERTRRQVSLTSAGKVFQAEAREILIQIRKAGEAARRAAGGETGKLEIGFVSAVLSPEMVKVFTRFREEHPQVQLNLHDRLPAEQFDALRRGELDLGFVGIAPEKRPVGILLTDWMEEPLMAFLPPDHNLARSAQIRLKDLKGEPFLMIAHEAAPAYAAHVRRICHEAGFRPRVVQEARRAQAVVAMTVAGSGVSILPASLNRITSNGLPLREKHNRSSKITHVIAHRADASSAVSDFLQAVEAK